MVGWSIQSYDGTSTPCAPLSSQIFDFPSGFVLRAGTSVRVHSGPDGGDRTPSVTDLPWTRSYIWNNDGDRADLRRPGGAVVDYYRYGRC
jgi:competence protein ComEC